MSLAFSAILATAQSPPLVQSPPHSFSHVYKEHFRFVWMSLRRLGVPESDTPDATQEVFLVVQRKLPTFEGRSTLRTWIFGIVIRVARSRRRGNKHPMVPYDDENAAMQRNEEDVGDAIRRRRARAVLLQIMDEMSPSIRVVFVMFELEGQRGCEIARTLGVSEGTVRSRLRLGREVFHRCAKRFQLERSNNGARRV